jgi:hypothetical protein
MAKDPEHFQGTNESLHVPVDNSTEGGACLTGHGNRYRPNSCSYRWQAVQESRANRTAIYDKDPRIHPDHLRAGVIPTSAYVSKRGNLTPLHHALKLAIPRPGDWHVSGPLRSDMKAGNGKPIPPGENFTKGNWPYWNQAHHLIPKSLFLRTIEDGELVPDPECRDLIKQALLRAKYNINHRVNMILLPQDKEAGRALGLPRHLVLEDGPEGLEPNPKFNHVAYTANVLVGLGRVINEYKTACDQELGSTCKTPEFELSKERLEELSAQCYETVIAHGARNPGAPISAMPPIPFR